MSDMLQLVVNMGELSIYDLWVISLLECRQSRRQAEACRTFGFAFSVIEVLLAPRSLCHILPTPFRLVVAGIFPYPEDLRADNDYAAANSEKDTE